VLLGCFSFNVYGMSLGCPSTDADCDWYFTGLRYNAATQTDDVIVEQFASTTSCPSQTNCPLVPVGLDILFTNLTQIQITGLINGAPMDIWWMDDLELGWTDNSCDAGLCRIGAKVQ
jgi:hypothetical protein